MRTLWSFCVLLLAACPAIAQSFSASSSKTTVNVGEQFKITFEVSGSAGGQFTTPPFNGFQMVAGPIRSSSTSIVNGEATSSSSLGYVLKAVQEGEYTIAPARLTVDGKTLQTEPITISVVKKNASTGGSTSNGSSAKQGSDKAVFIQLSLDKTKAFVGEQITATYTLYSRVNLIQNGVEKLPSFDGFYNSSIELPENRQMTYENISGQRYFKVALMKNILTPQYAGDIEIEPLEFKAVAEVRSQKAPRSFFEQFMGRTERVEYNTKTPARKIQVKPLPESGQKSIFTGAVGYFDYDVNLDRDSVPANEAINLTLTVSGRGNLDLIEKPELQFPPDFEVYDPNVSASVKAQAGGTRGTKSWEYLIIPRHKGTFTLPVLDFQYFNPSSEKYVTKTIDPIKVTVTGGDGATGGLVKGSTSKSKVEALQEDIRFVKSPEQYQQRSIPIKFGSMPFLILMIAPWLILLGIVIFLRKRAIMLGDTGRMRNKNAAKEVSKRLRAAKEELSAEKKESFFEEVHKALYGLVADKLNVPMAQVNQQVFAKYLSDHQISIAHIEKGQDLIESCEMARFSPGGLEDAQRFYSEVSEWFNETLKSLK